MPPEIVECRLRAAERHVAVGENCIARQQAALARLRRLGSDLREATRLLALLQDIQRLHVADRDRLIFGLSRKATERQLAHGRFRIAQYHELISRLERDGRNSQSAEDQLALLQATQAVLLAHCNRLNETGRD